MAKNADLAHLLYVLDRFIDSVYSFQQLMQTCLLTLSEEFWTMMMWKYDRPLRRLMHFAGQAVPAETLQVLATNPELLPVEEQHRFAQDLAGYLRSMGVQPAVTQPRMTPPAAWPASALPPAAPTNPFDIPVTEVVQVISGTMLLPVQEMPVKELVMEDLERQQLQRDLQRWVQLPEAQDWRQLMRTVVALMPEDVYARALEKIGVPMRHFAMYANPDAADAQGKLVLERDLPTLKTRVEIAQKLVEVLSS